MVQWLRFITGFQCLFSDKLVLTPKFFMTFRCQILKKIKKMVHRAPMVASNLGHQQAHLRQAHHLPTWHTAATVAAVAWCAWLGHAGTAVSSHVRRQRRNGPHDGARDRP